MRRPLTARFLWRTAGLAAIVAGAAQCATVPVLPPLPTFEEKLSWILRLEDQRVLRDPIPAPPPDPVLQEPASTPLLPPPAAPDLTRLVAEPSAALRRRAAMAIGRVGLAEGVEPLVRALADPEPEVRQMSAFALGLIGDQAAVDPLVQALGDVSPIVQGRAAEALGLIGEPSSAEPIGEMVASYLTMTFDVDPEDVSYPLEPEVEAFRLGIYGLARLRAFEPLAAVVLDKDSQPILWWWPVAYALQRLEDPRALPALKSLATVQGSYGVAFAAQGLGALGDAEAVDTLVALLDAQRRDARVIATAIRALAAIGHAEAERPILRLVRMRGLDQTLLVEAVAALGAVGGEESADVLIDLVSHPRPPTRAAALRSLAQVDPDTFITVLSGLDPDSEWTVRAALAEALGFLEPEQALPRLATMLIDHDPRVLPSVLTTLAAQRAATTTTALLEGLRSGDVVVRMAAARLIGELQPGGGVAALVDAYERGARDSSYVARAAALAALAKYGRAADLDALKAGLSDPDWAVRVHAAAHLEELEGSGDVSAAIRPAPTRLPESAYAAEHLVRPSVSPHVYIETDKGTIVVELAVLDAPMTADNFMTLARAGYFNGLMFHRVVPNYVVQAGDPRGDSEGGPGYTIRDELNQIPYLRGTVGMARDWSDTGGSQFFITHSPQPHLDARYTAFGTVVAGMDVVDQLDRGDVIRRVEIWDGVSPMSPSDSSRVGDGGRLGVARGVR